MKEFKPLMVTVEFEDSDPIVFYVQGMKFTYDAQWGVDTSESKSEHNGRKVFVLMFDGSEGKPLDGAVTQTGYKYKETI